MPKAQLLLPSIVLFTSQIGTASIVSVKVINDTSRAIYVHQGGYAPSQRIAAGKWKRYSFPFSLTPPNSKTKIYSNLLVATAGGRWETTANGFTFLDKPRLVACLDYGDPSKKGAKGKRTWTISSTKGINKGCYIKGFRQLWWQPPY